MLCKNINYCNFHKMLSKNTLNMKIEIEKHLIMLYSQKIYKIRLHALH